MSKVCQITGKKVMVGNKVSHSNHKTKRTFDINLFKKSYFIAEEDRTVSLRVTAAGMRTIDKLGIKEALKRATEKGYFKA